MDFYYTDGIENLDLSKLIEIAKDLGVISPENYEKKYLCKLIVLLNDKQKIDYLYPNKKESLQPVTKEERKIRFEQKLDSLYEEFKNLLLENL